MSRLVALVALAVNLVSLVALADEPQTFTWCAPGHDTALKVTLPAAPASVPDPSGRKDASAASALLALPLMGLPTVTWGCRSLCGPQHVPAFRCDDFRG